MTRTEDKYVSLEERAEIAKKANADALISIHLNAQKKYGDANGLETWYRNGATDGSKAVSYTHLDVYKRQYIFFVIKYEVL